MNITDKIKAVKKMLEDIENDLPAFKWHEDIDGYTDEEINEIVDDLNNGHIKIKCLVTWNTKRFD